MDLEPYPFAEPKKDETEEEHERGTNRPFISEDGEALEEYGLDDDLRCGKGELLRASEDDDEEEAAIARPFSEL